MAVKVNNKKLKALEEALKVFNNITIKVGIQDDAGMGEDGKTKIVDYGYWNEYGTRSKKGNVHIPRRSFIRDTAKMNDNWKAEMQAAFEDVVYKGEKPIFALSLVGVTVADNIKTRIRTGIGPANAPETIKRKKGKTTPLIEHGRLRNSIKYKLVRDDT